MWKKGLWKGKERMFVSQLFRKNKNIYVEVVVSREWISLWVTIKMRLKSTE